MSDSAITLDAYAAPPAELLYSKEYFKKITFAHAAATPYPTILKPGSMISWIFDARVLTNISEIAVTPEDQIPCLADLLPITSQLGNAFQQGSRSVHVVLKAGNKETNIVYHFTKVRLLVNVNNGFHPIRHAKALWSHINSAALIASNFCECLGSVPIHSAIEGFKTSKVSLWKLGYLLSEEWLEEDLVNTLCELRYFYHWASASDTKASTHAIILPTLFYHEIKYLMDIPESQRQFAYSKNLIELRKCIQANKPSVIHLVTCQDHHFSAQKYDAKTGTLEHCDSLGRPPPAGLLSAFIFLLQDLALPFPDNVKIVSVPMQTMASGSCAIAALNFIERDLNETVVPWSNSSSTHHQNIALRNLLVYHFSVQGKSSDTSMDSVWFHPLPLSELPSSSSGMVHDGPFGFLDFNLYSPSIFHPIHLYCRLLALQPLSDLNAWTAQLDGLGMTSVTAALSPSKLPKQEIKCIQALTSDSSSEDQDIEIIDLTCSSPPPRPSAPFPPADFGAPTPTKPKVKLELQVQQKPNIETIAVVDLCTPSPISSPLHSPPLYVSDVSVADVSPEPDSDTDYKAYYQDLAELNLRPDVKLGSVFTSEQEARYAIYSIQERAGFCWRVAQSKRSKSGNKKKIMYRCRQYYAHQPVHSLKIDPADHRSSKSVRCGCNARVNLNHLASGLWTITFVDFAHCHPPELAVGTAAPHRPTSAQKKLVSKYVKAPDVNFNRTHMAAILNQLTPDNPLELRQISNIMNQAKAESEREIEALGGDIATILASLQQLKDKDPLWQFQVRVDETQQMVALWWQSPEQAGLSLRYWDLLLNDNTYNRNQYGYPLNVGIGIDNFGCSRNLWYCFQECEDAGTHIWVLQNHLLSASKPPEVFFSDRHQSLIRAVATVMPTTLHIYCLHHLDGNITTNIRPVVGPQWQLFTSDFWKVYRAVSPRLFDLAWNDLNLKYPMASAYLSDLYECRERWAWAWISSVFTAGIRTNGCVEAENRVNKVLGGPKKTLFQVFGALNDRTNKQSLQEAARVRQLSRRQHDKNIEGVFKSVLKLARSHLGPFALHTIYREIRQSLYYRTEVIQLPAGKTDWLGENLSSLEEPEFSWMDNEEQKMLNLFENDDAYISIRWILEMLKSRGLQPTHILRIRHMMLKSTHLLAILPENRYVCDCAMGINIGIPCCHYFQAWTTFCGLRFHIGLVRQRWYQSPELDISTTVSTIFDHAGQRLENTAISLPSILMSNPLQKVGTTATPPPATQTIGAREVNHEAQALLRPILNSVRTREELTDVLEDLRQLKRARIDAPELARIQDPPLIKPKGRPWTARITGRLEGRPRGGGPVTRTRSTQLAQNPISPQPTASGPSTETTLDTQPQQQRVRRCGICRQPGHNRTQCSLRSVPSNIG